MGVRWRRLGVACLPGLLLATAHPPARAAIQESAFTETTVVPPGPIGGATAFAWAGDGSDRLFITLQPGQIRVVKDGVLLPQPFVTVAPVYTSSECGLTGIAFDPAFLLTRHMYLFACVSSSEQQVIRYTIDGDVATEKTTIVAGLPTVGQNHDGGGIGFGPDGKLYWSIGDLGNLTGTNADLASMASKVGRANKDGTPAADNPFVDGMGPNADFIWARGFRNPFTLTFQPATGLLWVNDVGAYHEQIFIVRRGDHAGWQMYSNNQPAGFITPTIKYATGITETRNLAAGTTGAVRANGSVTFTTTQPHGFRRGEKLTIIQVNDPSFNGMVYVGATPTPTTFVAAQPGPAASSGGGTATTTPLGGAVTGGAFYDSTAFPPSHRGNFFFGDFNSQRVMRAVIDPRSNEVSAVDTWATQTGDTVDVSVGPDGNLYHLGHNGAVWRVSYNGFDQGLVVTPTNVWMADGEAAPVTVRLATRPPEGVSLAVTVAPGAGDSDIGLRSGATLTFTEANWSRPQRVTVGAGYDLDSKDDVGTLTVSAPGLAAERVTVNARDVAGPDLVVSSMTLDLPEDSSAGFSVALSHQPFLDLVVRVERSAGDPEITVGAGAELTFTSANWATPQTVNVLGGRHAGTADRSATFTVGGSGLVPKAVMVTVRNNASGSAPNAGVDAAAVADAGVADVGAGDRVEGGRGSQSDDGCGCRLGGREPGGGPWLILVSAAWLWGTRRGQAARCARPAGKR